MISMISNVFDEDVNDMIKISLLISILVRMAKQTHIFSKNEWKCAVWNTAWQTKNEECRFTKVFFIKPSYQERFLAIVENYLSWWMFLNDDYNSFSMSDTLLGSAHITCDLKADTEKNAEKS